MMQVPSGPFHIQHLSAIIFLSRMLRGATNDLFTVETINLEYLYIMQWTGQL